MKFKMPSKTGFFGFSDKGPTIAQTCVRVLELTKEASASGSLVQHIMGVDSDRNVFIMGYSPEAMVIERLGIGKGEGFAVVDLEAVRDLTKKKTEVDIETVENNLCITSGRSKSTLPTTLAQPDTVPFVNSTVMSTATDSDSLPDTMLACLTEGTKASELKDVYKLEKTLVTHLICEKKKPLKVLSYDQTHAAIYTSEVSGDRDFRVAMPTKLFQIVSKFTSSSKEEAKFFVDASGLRVESEHYLLVLPPIQINKGELNQVLMFEEALRTWGSFKMKAELLDSIKAALTLSDPKGGSSFEMQISAKNHKGRIRTRLTSSRGEVEEKYPLKDHNLVEDLTVKVDPRLLQDMMRKISGDAIVKVCGFAEAPSLILFKTTDSRITCWGSLV